MASLENRCLEEAILRDLNQAQLGRQIIIFELSKQTPNIIGSNMEIATTVFIS